MNGNKVTARGRWVGVDENGGRGEPERREMPARSARVESRKVDPRLAVTSDRFESLASNER